MNQINDLEQLRVLVKSEVYLYGAGARMWLFFSSMQEAGISVNIPAILVSKAEGNPKEIQGIPVKALDQSTTVIKSGINIILTVSECFVREIEENILKICSDANVYTLDFNIIDSIPALNVRKHIEAFIEHFSDSVCEYNAPVHRKFTIWSCWWQGVDNAPEIVKACI